MTTITPVRVRRDASKSVRSIAHRGKTARGRWALSVVGTAEDVMHYAVAGFLLVVAAVVLVHSTAEFLSSEETFSLRITSAINGMLFVVIVMEILRTVLAHFDDAGLQLKPFLIIGIISAVRHILTVGAQISLGAGSTASEFQKSQMELGINAAVVIALVVGLVLIRRSDTFHPVED